MKDTLVRGLTGLLFISIVIGSILLSTGITALVFSLFAFIGYWEYNRMTNSTYPTSSILPFCIGALLLAHPILIHAIKAQLPTIELTGLLVTTWLTINLFKKQSNVLELNAIKLFGILYIFVPFALIIHLNYSIENKMELIGIFVLIWSNDTFAYLFGRAIGKTKLFERISPKKTWEGTIGGIVLTIFMGIIWSKAGSNESMVFWMICALLMSLSAIFGDLFESQLKRQFKVKDSGKILPGHGGILDRFDASLFGFTLFYLLWSIYH